MKADSCSSPQFLSLSASGPDWRSVAQQCVEELERLKTDGQDFSLGLIYVTEELGGHLASILTLLRNVTGVAHWYGCAGLGVFSHAGVHMGLPGLSMMLGRMDEADFIDLADWAQANMGDQARHDWADMMPASLLHAVPDDQELSVIMEMAQGSYAIGGVSSTRGEEALVAGGMARSGGVVFSPDCGAQIAVMRGWQAMHDGHNVTGVSANIVETLDNQPAFHAMQKVIEDSDMDLDHTDRASIHVSFALSDADQDDQLLRNITSVDETQNSISVAHLPQMNERMTFVYRTLETAGQDMVAQLESLQQRLQGRVVTGAVYISCVARVDMMDTDWDEVDAIRSVLGRIPLTGFYAVGEVARNALRGYSGVLMVFTREDNA